MGVVYIVVSPKVFANSSCLFSINNSNRLIFFTNIKFDIMDFCIYFYTLGKYNTNIQKYGKKILVGLPLILVAPLIKVVPNLLAGDR